MASYYRQPTIKGEQQYRLSPYVTREIENKIHGSGTPLSRQAVMGSGNHIR